jgi:hypothetical protein
MDVPEAPGTTVLLMTSCDGSDLLMQEISQLADGGRRRFRVSQTLQGGRLVGRSLIDEHKVGEASESWPPSPGDTDG